MDQRVALFSIIFVALCCYPARGQAPPAVLKVEFDNLTFYEIDTADSSQFGINPGFTSSSDDPSKRSVDCGPVCRHPSPVIEGE